MLASAFELSLTSPRLRGEVGDGAQRRLRVRGTLRESSLAERPLTPTLSPQERGEGAQRRPEKDKC
ncbi:hypothetical protein SAMN05444159_2286 [Bradyrhizobium lablabi]|uniref:Uncharacterized protein n=1 Tax=Bradyrhizobium lablabi TaxID=722472 RepID=A0A1M6PBC0_9BRAD|nr:hypothetical protein SAMN05444159_2286 [Bradyrhizobium lablabi]